MEFDYINGMNLGLGFNTATLNLHPAPALSNVTSTQRVINAGGQEVFFRLELSSDTLSLFQQLNFSSRSGLKVESLASGSSKINYLNSFQQNNYTIYICVYVLVKNEQTILDLNDNPLKKTAANLWVRNPKEFVDQYGDSFIYSINTGGEYLGVIEITSSSTSEFQKIQAALSAQATWGIVAGDDLKAFDGVLQKIKASFSLKASVMRRGTVGQPIQIEPEQMIKDAINFPSKVTGTDGYPYSVQLIPYNDIPHPVASSLSVANQLNTLEKLGNWREQFVKFQNDLSYVINHQQLFPNIETKISEISERYNQISNEISKIVEAANMCFSDDSSCSLPKINLELLDRTILPDRITFIPNLGTIWYEEEAGWNGIWTRRGMTNIFDAKWSRIGFPDVSAVLTIDRIEENKFIIKRKNSSDGNDCDYTGTLESDGRTVTGEYKCTHGGTRWRATITD